MDKNQKYETRIMATDRELMEMGDALHGFHSILEGIPKTVKTWRGRTKPNPAFMDISKDFIKARREFWRRAKELHPDVSIGQWNYEYVEGIFIHDATDDTRA